MGTESLQIENIIIVERFINIYLEITTFIASAQ